MGASIVAKLLLSGEFLVVTRCEEILISGGQRRQKMKYDRFVRKCSNSNPKRSGPIHLRAPSKRFLRVVRGMMPHKTVYGSSALNRLACFEGVPAPYDKVKLVVLPQALKVLRKPHGRAVTRLGSL